MKPTLTIALLLSAFSAAQAGTLGDISRRQAEVETAELEAKAARARADASVQGMAAQNQQQIESRAPVRRDDIRLNAIFGVGTRLAADVAINGAAITFRQGETLLGWQARRILPHEMWLVQIRDDAAGKAREGRTLHLMLVGGEKERPALPSSLPTRTPSPALPGPVPPEMASPAPR